MKIMQVNNNNNYSRNQKQRTFGMNMTDEVTIGLKQIGQQVFSKNAYYEQLYNESLPAFTALLNKIGFNDLTISNILHIKGPNIDVHYKDPRLPGFAIKRGINIESICSSPKDLLPGLLNIFRNDAKQIAIHPTHTGKHMEIHIDTESILDSTAEFDRNIFAS